MAAEVLEVLAFARLVLLLLSLLPSSPPPPLREKRRARCEAQSGSSTNGVHCIASVRAVGEEVQAEVVFGPVCREEVAV
jgi:hypothetical protein